MRNWIVCFALIMSSLHVFSQYNGYSLSTRGVRIYDASASVLAEINKIPNIENRLVQIGEGISQSDFDNICAKFKWMLKLSIEHTSGEITDLSSLKKVKDIEFLQLKNCADDEPISLAPVAELDSLKELVVVATQIKDYEALSQLGALEAVTFEKSPLASLEFLSQMKQLKRLSLAGGTHTFTNYDVLGKLNKLTTLDVSYNPQATTDNLDVFSDVATFTKIDVSECDHLKSLGFLYSSTSRLQEFYAVGCDSISNYDMLIRATKLKKVDLSHSATKNVEFLKNKANIKELNVAYTQVASIVDLELSTNLEKLDISHTNVSDVSVLAAMSKLKRLNISHTNVTDVSALAGCVSLTDFDCSHTQIASVEGMETCVNLSKINVGFTPMESLRPFYSAKKVKEIIVDEDMSPVHLDALKRRSPLIIINYAKVKKTEDGEQE
ncbi:MAG: leucine-rich repeat domain-containing protein [Bacteroidales bacterium]|nr:leucine-rich repeat domain-containing protein [Bacteroidales bacterium]